MKCWIFIDESGKPEIYSNSGKNLVLQNLASRFLVLAAIRSHDQLGLQRSIAEFRLSLLQDDSLKEKFSTAYTLDSFHAQTDYDEVKQMFYKFIITLDLKIDVLVVEKLKCYPTLRTNPGKLYAVMAGQLLKNITHQSEDTEIIFSRKDSKLKARLELNAEVDRIRLEYLQVHATLPKEYRLSFQHNPHYSHGALQVADYIAYAVYQLFERQNDKWYQLVTGKIGKIQDICNKKYYTRSNSLKLSDLL